MQATPLVRVDGVSKSYRAGGSETHVLSAASLELARGETTSLIGPSGSGKSTLIALLAGLLLPDSGSIIFDDQDVGSLDDSARARLRAKRIGVVLQSGNLFGFLTAMENVAFAYEIAGGRHPAARAKTLLTELGLADRQEHRPSRMSGGEQQRVALAMALANQPDLLLADEVTGELDSQTASQVMRVIHGVCREHGLTVLFVTHDAVLAAGAQRLYEVDDGRIRPA